MFCAGRVPEEDMKRTMKACGGSIQTSVQNMKTDVLGSCETFEEIQVGGERYEVLDSKDADADFDLNECSICIDATIFSSLGL